ncbi:MAG: hypothetical protein QGI89_03090 [Candidatus Woesearchaeota archaeon]|jgi:hypothetical protein|nr:hypothetical protein [Candidatus Woesearchaeota archaeon]MDP7322340.1 hypothetical protein [Candidatus Woesearchaeota archaeon]HJO01627.1 hypothetical protein [Candidatus Woesearchaeota archaeon]|tara:strand:+ start:2316 stop:2597 length:282 start_codon:yes stop_codon:yes gene_type:complete
MNIFSHPKINSVIGIISEEVIQELRDFEVYYGRYKKKLEIVQRFASLWKSAKLQSTQKFFKRIKDDLLDAEKMAFLDLHSLKKTGNMTKESWN